ncbi:Leucine aminopeptidase 3, chloroplastic [Glycine soja]|nr:Leucine aminopeptidase 3, chloroplastic [Glycine soja]
MAAIATIFVSFTTTSSSLFLTRLTSRLHFAAFPLRSPTRKLMSHTLARATLGLTHPSNIETPKISFGAKDVDVTEWKGDILAVGVTEKDLARDANSKFENVILSKIDSKLGGLLAEASSEEDFSGKVGQSTVLRITGLGSKRVGLIGLGQSPSTPSPFKGLGEAVVEAAKSSQASSVAVVLASSEGLSAQSKLSTAYAIASGIEFVVYIYIIGFGMGPELEKKLKYAGDVSSGIIFGRELVNSPANVLTPVLDDLFTSGVLAEEAAKIASTYSDVFTAKILNAEQCAELKMGSYLGVAAASENPPHFIHLCYKPLSGPVNVKLALVGKGLTFDSGGYNIKTGPGCSIELMKFDMGGSAAVLGTAKALGQIKPLGVEALLRGGDGWDVANHGFIYIKVHFIVAACENMISGTGMRPGDIVTTSNGKTIEVNNTDAEGRLTLADALVYACNQGVEKIIDLATLTGACVVALGPSIAGVFTPSDDLAKEVFEASDVSGEKLWRLPLGESYWETMKSGVADMLNTGGRQGGAIVAALFLKQFVDEKVQWMHIDMVGPM